MQTIYTVRNMRVLLANGKRKDSSIVLTVKGQFANSNGDALSFKSKDITNAQATSPEFAIDMVKGTLSLPGGKRGKPTTQSATQAEVNSFLNSLKVSK